jgi:hypothetical protein
MTLGAVAGIQRADFVVAEEAGDAADAAAAGQASKCEQISIPTQA